MRRRCQAPYRHGVGAVVLRCTSMERRSRSLSGDRPCGTAPSEWSRGAGSTSAGGWSPAPAMRVVKATVLASSSTVIEPTKGSKCGRRGASPTPTHARRQVCQAWAGLSQRRPRGHATGRRRDGAPPTLSLSAASRLRRLSSLTSRWKSPKLSGRGLGFAAGLGVRAKESTPDRSECVLSSS
jgi:hypothetical protein